MIIYLNFRIVIEFLLLLKQIEKVVPELALSNDVLIKMLAYFWLHSHDQWLLIRLDLVYVYWNFSLRKLIIITEYLREDFVCD